MKVTLINKDGGFLIFLSVYKHLWWCENKFYYSFIVIQAVKKHLKQLSRVYLIREDKLLSTFHILPLVLDVRVTKKKLDTFQNGCLRQMLRIRGPENTRMKTGTSTVSDKIANRKWGWTGHDLRMYKTSICTTALTWHPKGR